MMDLLFVAVATSAAIVVGLAKGGIPAAGILAVPIMSLLLSPVTAVAILLPVYIISDMAGVWAWRHDFDRNVLKSILPGAAVGTLFGWMTASIVPEAAVTLVVGAIGLAYAARSLSHHDNDAKPRQPNRISGLFWGVVTGFASFVSYAGAPPFQIYVLPLRLPSTTFVGTSTIAFAIMNFAKIGPFFLMGEFDIERFKISVLMMPIALLSVWAGVWLVKIIPVERFFKIVLWALFALSLKLVYDGISALV